MPVNLPPEIQQANACLQAGQKQTARAILMDLVRREPDAELAWLMLSRTFDDPHQRADCLRQALRINPQNEEARRQIEALNGTATGTGLEKSQPTAHPQPAWTPPPMPLDLLYSEAKEPAGPPARQVNTIQKPADIPIPAASAKPVDGRPAASKPAAVERKSRLSRGKIIGLAALGVLVVGLACMAGLLVLMNFIAGRATAALEQTALAQAAQPVTQAASLGLPSPASPTATPRPGLVLPPTWTPTPSPTATATRTVTPTPAPSTTPTFQAPPATAAALMARIEDEVSDLRGLPIQSRPPRYLVSQPLVEQMLRSELEATGGIEQLKDESRFLSALNLIKPTYDIVRYAMNGLVDGIGGFYRPETKEIYVLGLQFRGMEHFVYSHEFDHALVDQKFDLQAVQKQASCATKTDPCLAVRALIEGDATLLMVQWLKQYASPQDYRDLYNYRMPSQALPEQFPPEYVTHSLDFPYQQGLLFVAKLYEDGNWARVNQAYANPPISSEQIMHAEKYLKGEAPSKVEDPSLELALGKPWRLIKDDTLGEFHTFLLLAYSADVPARRTVEAAQRAAAGWGGDQVQVYYNDETGQTALAVHWVWDTTPDAQEFELSMREFLDMLMRGAHLESPAGYCWEGNGKATCLYIRGNETLWLSAPDQATLEPIKMLFSKFTTP